MKTKLNTMKTKTENQTENTDRLPPAPARLPRYSASPKHRPGKIVAEIEKAKRANDPPGISPETLALIERELNLM